MSSRVYDLDRRTGRFPDVGAAFHLGSETAPEPLTPPPPRLRLGQRKTGRSRQEGRGQRGGVPADSDSWKVRA